MTATDPELDFLGIDVARLLGVDHAPRGGGNECACMDRPDGGSWTLTQRTWAEHATAELAAAGYLRDDLLTYRLTTDLAIATRQSPAVVRLAHGITTYTPGDAA